MSYVLKPPRPPTSSSSSSSAGHLLGISIQLSRLQHQCLSSGTANSPQRPSHVRAFDGELLSVCTGFTAVRRLHHLQSNCVMVATTPMAGGSGCGRHCCLGRRSQQPPFFVSAIFRLVCTLVLGSPCGPVPAMQRMQRSSLVLTNTQHFFGSAAAFLLGPNHVCQGCQQLLDPSGDHAVSCTSSGLCARHTRLRDALPAECTLAGLPSEGETQIPYSNIRPADTLVHPPYHPSSTAVDVSAVWGRLGGVVAKGVATMLTRAYGSGVFPHCQTL